MFIAAVINEEEITLSLWDYSKNRLCQVKEVSFQNYKDQMVAQIKQWLQEYPVQAIIYQKITESTVRDSEDWLKYIQESHELKRVEIPLMWEADLPDIARISGLPEIERVGIFDRVAHAAAIETITPFPDQDGQLIVACMDDGVSVAAYRQGGLLDVNNSLDGEGPMGLKRAGSLFTGDLITLAFRSGKRCDELYQRIVCEGGWESWKHHLTEKEWEEILAYQVIKEIGAMRAVLKNKVDRIILTGRLAARTHLIESIKSFLPAELPLHIVPDVNRSLGLARIWIESINFRFRGC